MNFSQTLLAVDLVLKTGEVPLIIGHSGIGKTALVKELSKKGNYKLITIDANLLKEGEIGGLPTLEDYKEYNSGKIRKKTVYAIHTKLQEIDDYINNNSGTLLLFIDEINRCEHTVQQELMNLILNREINGYKLNSRVSVVAAMNPSNKYDDFEDSEYEVVDMDPAQEDRFVWIEMESNSKEWIKWGIKEKTIHPHVLEFVALFPEHLHSPSSNETIKATPRSWERISKAYEVYLNNKDTYPLNIFYNVVKGNVGGSIAQDFIGFAENYKALPISPKSFFENIVIPEDLKEKLEKESHSRLYVIAKNLLMYLNDKEIVLEDSIRIFSKLLKLYPVDLRIGIMREIKMDFKDNLYDGFLECDEFIDLFFESYR